MALDLNDKTANGNNLTNVNTVSEVTTNLPFAQSTIAAGFAAASSQRFTMADAASLKPSGNFTIELWGKPNLSSIGRIFSIYSQNTNVAGFELYMNISPVTFLSGKNTGVSTGTDYQTVAGATNINDNAWHHIAGVYNGSTMKVFIAAVEDGSVAWSNAAAYAATTYPRIGCENASGSDGGFFNGNMDEIRLWSVARTSTELSNNMNVQLTGNESGLQAYYPFENLFSGHEGYFLSLSGAIQQLKFHNKTNIINL